MSVKDEVKEDLNANNDKTIQKLTAKDDSEVKEDVFVNYDESKTESSSYEQTIIDFINNKTLCWYGNENETYYFSQILYGLEEGLGKNNIISYTLVDMDKDGSKEVILELNGQYDDYYLIISYSEQIQMNILYKD